VFGTVLFALSRKIVWGRDESLEVLWVWVLALIPYALYVLAVELPGSSDRRMRFVRESDFVSIWTVSLLLFVFLRTTGLADIYEDRIYGATEPGAYRYWTLSIIYIGLGFCVVTAWRLTRTHRARTAQLVAAHATSFVAGVLLFCMGVFLIAF
jgi:hypothetical protein